MKKRRIRLSDIRNFHYIQTVVLLLLSCIVVSQKQTLFLDEVSTFELANFPFDYDSINNRVPYQPTIGKAIKNNIVYSPASAPWIELMTVHQNQQFDFKNVWANQTSDVHPPFYYSLVHSLCSFFPGKFNIWFGLVINIFFVLMSLYFLTLLTQELINNQWLTYIVSTFFVISPAILNATALIRMYNVAMAFILLLSYLFVKLYKANTWNWTLLLQIAICTILGALTHYYVILYVIALTFIFVLLALFEKQNKKALVVSITMIVCAAIAVAIFPAMLDHALGTGVHGQNAKAAILDFANIKQRMHRFFSMADALIFGFTLPLVVLSSVAFFLWLFIRKRRKSIPIGICFDEIKPWIIVALPTFIYFVVVAQTATYIADRYHYPIYPLIILLVVSFVWWMLNSIPKVWIRNTVFILFLATSTISAYRFAYWGNLGIIPKEQSRILEQHNSSDCVFIHKGAWSIYETYNQIKTLNSVIFFHYNDMAKAKTYIKTLKSPFILYIDDLCNTKDVQQQIGEQYSFEMIYKYGLGAAYLVKN